MLISLKMFELKLRSSNLVDLWVMVHSIKSVTSITMEEIRNHTVELLNSLGLMNHRIVDLQKVTIACI